MRNDPATMRRYVLVLFAALLITGFAGRYYFVNPERGLPYRASFTKSVIDNWSAYAGTWEIVNGSMRNNSDDRGAKLITGPPGWRNYIVDADLQLLGPGDGGLMARVSDAETGVDAYTGFYAGLRTNDGSLVLGKAQHGWSEFPSKSMPNGVQPFRWYHLRLGVFGCEVFAVASLPDGSQSTTNSTTLKTCPETGAIGLRSYYSGGAWRNVIVSAFSDQSHIPPPPVSVLPPPEPGANNRILLADYINVPQNSLPAPSFFESAVQSISSLKFASPLGLSKGVVRGQVSLVTPTLFVQDATGGVAVNMNTSASLKIGDEVEVNGLIRPQPFGALIEQAQVRLLWGASASPPLSVTANQAASGAFNARFIQTVGSLAQKTLEPDGTVALRLESGAQAFRALLNAGRIGSKLDRLRIGSTVRLRGICTVDSAYTKSGFPFALLIRSAEDLEIAAGPPWYSLRSLIPFAIGLTIILAFANHMWVLAKHWRLRAIAEERSRLAHEIHDTLAQSFAGIGYQLRAVRHNVPEHAHILRQHVDLACDMVRHSHDDARHSILTLRPEYLEGAELSLALRNCAERMVGNAPLVINASGDGTNRAVPLRIKDTLYRMGQEAIANALSHSEAKEIDIQVQYQASLVILSVRDDGRGFSPDSPSTGLGLPGMRRRAQTISANLEILSSPTGTKVRVTAPFPVSSRIAIRQLIFGRLSGSNGSN